MISKRSCRRKDSMPQAVDIEKLAKPFQWIPSQILIFRMDSESDFDLANFWKKINF